MRNPRFGFWLLACAALAVAGVALSGGPLRALFGVPAALGVALVARKLRPGSHGEDQPAIPERVPRRAVAAGLCGRV